MNDQQTQSSQADGELVPIAIIGQAFEFPQEATTAYDFWQMISSGRSASTEFPPDRMSINAFYHPDEDRPSTIPLRGGHFIKTDLAAFDAPFFSITPGEAACMDPQHRRMLETAYHALEDAGIPLETCTGSDTSVYTGCFTNDYLSILQQDYQAEQRHAAMGIAPSMLANRLSWFFNFKGASMNLDSACSSSLVALHLACQDLRARNSSMALVGGANLVYHPNFMKIMSDFNFLSRDSRCWSFDQRANGYARGEGFAVIIVKRLDDALRDGDTIRAVIRNTGLNQDGRTPGITQPSEEAQVELIKKTYRQANIDMKPTRFFEAHATGTPVGDPIEGNGIGKAFQHCRTAEDPLYIGAVKANIGHLEGASGLAGIIKTILVLEKGCIPPVAGFEMLNPRVDADKFHLRFPTQPIAWPVADVRRACVNSFGFGGTNAVAILDDAYNYLRLRGIKGNHRTHPNLEHIPPTQVSKMNDLDEEPKLGTPSVSDQIEDTNSLPYATLANGISPGTKSANGTVHEATCEVSDTRARLLIWSAPDQQGAQRLGEAYRDYLNKPQLDFELDNLAYALMAKRSLFSWRGFAVVKPRSQASSTFLSTEPVKAMSNSPRVAFVFTGQGAQYLGMGRELISFPAFRGSLEHCDGSLKSQGCKWSLLEVICDRSSGLDINTPEYSQPLTTCLQIALVDLLHSLGIVPSIVLGHSSGEIAAAYALGSLERDSAVKVAYHRGVLSSRLVDNMSSGLPMMMAVGISRHDVMPYLQRLRRADGALHIQLGCVNSPQSITLTGDAGQLTTIEAWFKADGVFARKLRVPIAYHSRFMEKIAADYGSAIKDLQGGHCSAPVSMISSVSGNIVTAQDLRSPEYWVRNLTSTVEFETAFSNLLILANRKPRRQLGKRQLVEQYSALTHILEVGPHSALRGPIRDSLQASSVSAKPKYIASLNRGEDASASFLKALGVLYSAGFPVKPLMANGLEEVARPMPIDMPRYSFNHSQKYWRESSLSRNLRFREVARHDLLGTPSLDWNAGIAQWRNVVRLAELPWLEDHKIGSNIVFPAAGMVAMAIEAVRQLFNSSEQLYGVHIYDTAFSHAITLHPGADSIETQMTLTQPLHCTNAKAWSQFRLFALENGSYIECASGSIRAVFDEKDRDRVLHTGPWSRNGTLGDWVSHVEEACGDGLERDPYDVSGGTEVRYGPAFQNLHQMRVGPHGEVVARINTESWRMKSTGSLEPSFAIHPATLDGLAQPLLQALLAQRPQDLPTMVPVRVNSIWVDCITDDLHRGSIHLAAECRFNGYRGGCADIVATTAVDHNRPVVYMEGLETAFIGSVDSTNRQLQSGATPRRLCTRLVWKPDFASMTGEHLLAHCTRQRPQQAANAVESYKSLLISILCFIEEVLPYIDHHSELRLEPHLEAYVSWMRYQQQQLRTGLSLITLAEVQDVLNNPEARETLNCQIEKSGVDGFFFIQIGRKLPQILRGEIDPLDFMFRDGLADRYYEAMLANDHHAYPASQLVDLMCFKNPSMDILEVGAGTGGQTMRLLDTMSRDGVCKWSKYDYTDVSPGFFGNAREKFSHLENMDFRVCDISKDPIAQRFEAASYDLVVASHVLHATDNLQETLRNIRKLLKPYGKLLLFETTRPEAIPVGFAFGLLKGWWSPLTHEPRAPHSPCITVAQWDVLLRETGFSGVDIDIPGQEEPFCRDSSILMSTAANHTNNSGTKKAPSQQIHLIVNDQIESQLHLSKAIEAELSGKTTGVSCKTLTLAQLAGEDITEPSMSIFLMEVDADFLEGVSEVDYTYLQSVLVRSKQTLWVTRAEQFRGMNPGHHLADGLGRTLMSEDSARKFVTLSLDGLEIDLEKVSNVVCELSQNIILSETVEAVENNYTVAQGVLQICRVSESVEMDTTVARAILPRQIQEKKLTADTKVALRLSPGHLNTLEWFESDEGGEADRSESRADQDVQADEVVVNVRAIGLTFRDNLVARGQLNELGLGTECAGVVQMSGSETGLKVGDRVCLISSSTARSTIRVKSGAVTTIPPYMTFAEAASMPSCLWVSYHAVVNLASLQEGEVVLIHQGTSCVSQFAIQLARNRGARVLVTTSSAAKAKFICDEFQVPKTDIFYDDDPVILNKIHQATKGQGVDVILGALAKNDNGNRREMEFSTCLAPFGRLVDTSLPIPTQGPLGHLGSDLSVNTSRSSINMIELLEKRPALAHRTFQRAMRCAFDEHLRPPQPLHSFAASDVEAAFSHLSDHAVSMGKRVIELKEDMIIKVNIKTSPAYSFSENATYVIGGGLGGLGRSFTRWMARRGAKYLILLSRSGPKSEAAKALVRELEAQKVCVAAPAVDIANLPELKRIIRELSKSMPPDNLFPNMTYEDWTIGVNSKATGSWNLHAALPSGLDFFVLLASLNGIVGGRAQANYAAANTFKDSLAQYRISIGEKAVSLDLGLMVTEGIVAENAELLASMRRIGHLMDISQGELLALMDYYCNPSLPVLPRDQAQVLIGLETTTSVRAKGIDLHHAIHRPLFRQLFRMDTCSSSSLNRDVVVDYAMALRQASSDEAAGALVTDWFRAKISQVLGLQQGDVDPERPVHTYGMDSLVAIDLKNWYAREIGAEVSVFMLLGNNTLEEVAKEAAKGSRFRL
ncbi:hypothetical protein VMCG_00852 [Cytospora schulzeri]|uniref:Uncharacterized protein n=1 Tax=Cytospora schulzeri TaxID=448051 RepID=A0A423X4T3_9PEZI|nr:hypothetical protein VMCG_00852 [Valsa malicola]